MGRSAVKTPSVLVKRTSNLASKHDRHLGEEVCPEVHLVGGVVSFSFGDRDHTPVEQPAQGLAAFT